MENFRLIIVGVSCMILLATVALINFTELNLTTLLKAQTGAALVMMTFLVVHFISEKNDAEN